MYQSVWLKVQSVGSRARARLGLAGLLAMLTLVAAACGGGPATEPSGQPAAPAEAVAVVSTESPSTGVVLDEYQASREGCTWETPCWPAIVDTIPASFSESPMLAEQVAAGSLPPVEERIPAQPLVIQPTEMIGQHGGTMRRGFTGPGDRPNIERLNSDHTIFWDTAGQTIVPRLAQAWEMNEDGSEWTFYLREGHKWSDGAPFTADDYLFWYEHILLVSELTPTLPWFMQWGGAPAEFEKIDDTTFIIRFAAPFPSWPLHMASTTTAGHYRTGRTGGISGGLFAPQHYLEQFHPNFIGEEEATRMATAAGYENWHLYFLAQNDSHMNVELPVMTPWKAVTRIASEEYVLERNPYYYAVDTEGNQLPYIDRISMELVEELEVLNLRAIAGNYTLQERHILFGNLPIIRENQAQGDYFVDFWTSTTRHPAKIAFNMDWNEDPEIAEFTVGSVDFRRALSLAIEREEINETFFLGVGKEASFCPANVPPYFNSDRWDEAFGHFDPAEANAILDSLGLDQRDAEGFRLMPSGRRLTLQMDAVSGAFLDYPSIGERIAQMWEQHVDVQLNVRPVERTLWNERMNANQPMMNMFETGEFNPATATRLIPSPRWGPLASAWGNNPNPDPDDYDGPEWIKEMVLKHWEAMVEPDPDRAMELLIEATEIMCDTHARLGLVVDVPVFTALIKNNVRNVPKPMEEAVYAMFPSNGLVEQWFILQD